MNSKKALAFASAFLRILLFLPGFSEKRMDNEKCLCYDVISGSSRLLDRTNTRTEEMR
jgi:hypothetical protein